MHLDTKLADRLASSATTSDTIEPARIGTPTTLSSKQQPQNLQADLVEAQRNRSELKVQLISLTAELETLQRKSKLDSKKIASLTQERNVLQVKLRDREEEIRGKTKLLEVSF
jgi:peptidoglycan hydrolase CwlO-like protein